MVLPTNITTPCILCYEVLAIMIPNVFMHLVIFRGVKGRRFSILEKGNCENIKSVPIYHIF